MAQAGCGHWVSPIPIDFTRPFVRPLPADPYSCQSLPCKPSLGRYRQDEASRNSRFEFETKRPSLPRDRANKCTVRQITRIRGTPNVRAWRRHAYCDVVRRTPMDDARGSQGDANDHDANIEERQKEFTRRALLRAGWVAPLVVTVNVPSAFA